MQFFCRRVNTAAAAGVVIAVKTLPAQLETPISTSRGGHGLSDPLLWVLSNLLVNPLLQTSLINSGPTTTAQRLACKVILRVLLNLGHRLIREVGTNHLQTSSRNILRVKGTHVIVGLTALQNVKVPKRLASIGTTVTTRTSAFYPLVFRQVLRQLILLRVLDSHTRNLVATPVAITLSRRRRIRADTREDASCRLMHQTVLIRHIVWKLRPHADLLTVLIPAPVAITRGTNGCVRTEFTSHTVRINIRRHLKGEVTVFIRLGVVHRRRVLSVLTLVPLGVHLNTLKGFTSGLVFRKTITNKPTGLDNLLHRAGDRTFLARITRRVNRLLVTANGRCVSLWCIRILILYSGRLFLSERNWLHQWRYQRKRQCGCSNRGATARFI